MNQEVIFKILGYVLETALALGSAFLFMRLAIEKIKIEMIHFGKRFDRIEQNLSRHESVFERLNQTMQQIDKTLAVMQERDLHKH